MHHAGGQTTVTVNQKNTGGIWVLLGTFDLDPAAGHRVVLADNANGQIFADAVRFVREGGTTAATEVVVDDVNATISGTWSSGGCTTGFVTCYGQFQRWTNNTSGLRSVTWTPTLPAAGNWKVYARWTTDAFRPSQAHYRVTHDGGTAVVTVSQLQNGGEWYLLGTFAMTPGVGQNVQLKNDHNGQNLIADAVKFERDAYASGNEIVIDNAAATVTGTWANNTWTGGGNYLGSNYLASNAGAGANVVTWTPTLASTGRWRAYARWIQYTNHAMNSKYRVFHAGGETVITVDQQRDGGRWIALGDYDLAPSSSHRVELKDDGNGYVIADAVRFVRLADTKFVAADAVKFVKNDAEALQYVHADHLGRPQKMTNTARQVVWDAQYRPFGEEHAIAGAGFNDERFPGQLWDDETGLHYNYFRDYDPNCKVFG